MSYNRNPDEWYYNMLHAVEWETVQFSGNSYSASPE
jgi:hypothetical protein